MDVNNNPRHRLIPAVHSSFQPLYFCFLQSFILHYLSFTIIPPLTSKPPNIPYPPSAMPITEITTLSLPDLPSSLSPLSTRNSAPAPSTSSLPTPLQTLLSTLSTPSSASRNPQQCLYQSVLHPSECFLFKYWEDIENHDISLKDKDSGNPGNEELKGLLQDAKDSTGRMEIQETVRLEGTFPLLGTENERGRLWLGWRIEEGEDWCKVVGKDIWVKVVDDDGWRGEDARWREVVKRGAV
ncbi:hypothetical protein BZA77DRAFT_305485 [Pyronema omphalodes]|nr:hypothetical protein BZA77DRAFT_305485 [Pyronema omphalodes]